MKYYNLKVVVLLKQNLENFETYEKIANLISYGMLKDKTLKELHEKNSYKNYVFCNLYPVQKDGIYKHLREDYSIANIVSVSKAKQFSATWGSLEPDNDTNKGTLYVLRKTLKDVDNTRAGYQLMGMTDI